MTNYNYGKVRVRIIQEYSASSVENSMNSSLSLIHRNGGVVQKVDFSVPTNNCPYYTGVIIYVEVEKNE